MKPLIFLFAFVVLSSSALHLSAQGLHAELQSYLVQLDDDGEAVFQATDSAAPGDVIEYRAVYSNTSEGDLMDIQAEIPVPEGTTFLAETDAPEADAVRLEDGDVLAMSDFLAEAARAELPDLRAVRWQLDRLPAGESLTVRARVRVSE